MEQLLSEKLTNCKQRLAPLIPEQYVAKWMNLDVAELKTMVLLAEPYWTAVDETNEELVLGVLELAGEDEIAMCIMEASAEDRKLAWRYAQFFLQAIRETLQN